MDETNEVLVTRPEPEPVQPSPSELAFQVLDEAYVHAI